MHIYDTEQMERRELVPGAEVVFVHSERMTLAHWAFAPGALVPEHAHPHEQVVNVIEGVFELTVEGETARLRAGSVAIVPPHASHSGSSVTDCRIIDAFHPVREDYR